MQTKYTPDDAERAIEDALEAMNLGSSKPGQIADLADAVEAYRRGAYGVAMVLARAAAHPLPANAPSDDRHASPKRLDEIGSHFFIARQHRFNSAFE